MLASLDPEQVAVERGRADAREVRRGVSAARDDLWSYVAKQSHPRWRWHAMDHHTGKVVASGCGRRKDAVFLRLQQLREPCGITTFSPDGWGAYERHVEAEQHLVGKTYTQKIARKPINVRTRITRLVRCTICLSKTERIHDVVVGLFSNREECGRRI